MRNIVVIIADDQASNSSSICFIVSQ